MYMYSKKNNHKKVKWLGICCLMMAVLGGVMWIIKDQMASAPVMKEEEFIISLPKKEAVEEKEEIIAPFHVEASVVLEYYDGNEHEVNDYTELAGVFRPNQGIDYAYQGESFDVVAMMSGEVSEVKNDELFGNSITISANGIEITYQSLDALNYQVKDQVKQNEVIGKASTNVYNPELGNHLHLVVMKNGTLCDPKSIIGKRLDALE